MITHLKVDTKMAKSWRETEDLESVMRLEIEKTIDIVLENDHPQILTGTRKNTDMITNIKTDEVIQEDEAENEGKLIKNFCIKTVFI